jgi:hypothetical protein
LPSIQRAYVVDDWYIIAYEPIRDLKNKVDRMLPAFAISSLLSFKIQKESNNQAL